MTKPDISIKDIWILNGSGICLVHRNYTGKQSIDQQLFCGLITAIVQMTREISMEESEDSALIEKIQMKDFDLHYAPIKNMKCSLVLSADHKIVIRNVERIINQISEQFYDFFHDSNLIDVVDLSQFKSFGTIVDNVVAMKGEMGIQKIDNDMQRFFNAFNAIKTGNITDTKEFFHLLVTLLDTYPAAAKTLLFTHMTDVTTLISNSKTLTNEQKSWLNNILTGINLYKKIFP